MCLPSVNLNVFVEQVNHYKVQYAFVYYCKPIKVKFRVILKTTKVPHTGIEVTLEYILGKQMCYTMKNVIENLASLYGFPYILYLKWCTKADTLIRTPCMTYVVTI